MYSLIMNEGDIWSVEWSLTVGSCMWIFVILSVMSINFYRAAAMQPWYFDKHLSVRSSIYTRVSNACIATKRYQLLAIFLIPRVI